jgi:hypothetical protein
MVTVCEALLAQFERMGIEICEIAIPELEAARVAHSITIAAEMAQALSHTYAEHHREHGLDVRTNLALARAFTPAITSRHSASAPARWPPSITC